MTEQEAFEAWKAQPLNRLSVSPEQVWHAALAWLRSQAEPVAWIGERDGMLWAEQADEGDTPLFLAPRAVEGDDREYLSAIAMIGSAMRRLVIAARTSGGTAGPDEELMAACAQAEDAMTVGAIGRAMIAPQPAIPDGWKLVPVEPTGDMWSAGVSAFIAKAQRYEMAKTAGERCAIADTAPEVIYGAMIADAPEPRK